MILYVKAKTELPRAIIDEIDVDLGTKSASLKWESSRVNFNGEGFAAKYEGVNIGREESTVETLQKLKLQRINYFRDAYRDTGKAHVCKKGDEIDIEEMVFVDGDKKITKCQSEEAAVLMRAEESLFLVLEPER